MAYACFTGSITLCLSSSGKAFVSLALLTPFKGFLNGLESVVEKAGAWREKREGNPGEHWATGLDTAFILLYSPVHSILPREGEVGHE